MDSREQLIALAIKHEGNWHNILRALQLREYVEDDEIDVNAYLRRYKCKVLTILDKEYPRYLRCRFQPPFVLFYYGDISLINDMYKNVAIVGSREPSVSGIENTRMIAEGVAKKYNIVSGLAAGLDAIAHIAAINMGGKTIAVLGNGIEYCYPSENAELYEELKKNHLVISEYFGYISPNTYNFPQRNRLIVMFSCATIVGEANHRSGSLMTANYTVSYHNTLMCIPSSDIVNSACDSFIKDGCDMVLSAQDVFDILE